MGNKKESGKTSASVDMRTGKVKFELPLFSLKTNAGAEFMLLLKYDSALMPYVYEMWNREVNTGLLGVGWNLNVDDNIFAVVDGADLHYLLAFKGMIFTLIQEEITSSKITYKTSPISNYIIEYMDEGYFVLYDEYGIKYIFGRDDELSINEKGIFDLKRGIYENNSEEYLKVRSKISYPVKEKDMPISPISDNTISSTKETSVSWGEWNGPSLNISNQFSKTICWRLSHIIDAFGGRIVFSYIQHLSNVAKDDLSKQYCICSYLYKISLYLNNIEKEKIVFEYEEKESKEYDIAYTLLERPNGIQYKFQKLFLSKIIHSQNNIKDKTYHFYLTPLNMVEDMESLLKRQLSMITIENSEQKELLISPGYHFEYYNKSDGVNVGKDGFSEENLIYNPSNGAVYGMIKSIQYPTGKIEEFYYSENKLTSVPIDIEESINNLKKQKQVISPYGIHVVMRLFNDNKYTITAYCWSVQGWFSNELLSGETTETIFDTYDMDIYVDVKENILVLTTMDRLNVKVYRIADDNITRWKEVNFSTTYIGTISSISTSSDKILICTIIDGVYNLYPYIFNADHYQLVGSPINVTEKCGVTAMVITTCMQDCWGVFTLYRDSYSAKPNGFTGNALVFYRNILRCFYIRNDGTTSAVNDIGYVPNAYISTNFTSPVPPIVTEPVELASFLTIGGNISKMKKVEKLGNIIYIPLKVKNQIGFFARNNPTQASYIREFDEMDWGVEIVLNKSEEKFKLMGESSPKRIEYVEDKFYTEDVNKMYLSTSAAASGNGITYTYIFNIPERNIKIFQEQGTIEYTYDGVEITVNKIYEEQNLKCIFRDNFFEAFYAKVNQETAGVYQKVYKYYDQGSKKFKKIETGSVDSSKTTFDQREENWLKYFGYAGLAFSIMLLPLGFTSIFGTVLSVLSIGLMAGTTIVQELLNNSIKITVDPNTAFYGNRFLVDGRTVWFRENGQNELKALGKGLNFEENEINGKILTDVHQYGTVYNYIPFFTNTNQMYYSVIKNGKLKKPNSLNGWSEGVSGMMLNTPNGREITLFKGNKKYIFIDGFFQKTEEVNIANERVFVDAAVKMTDENIVLYFSGKYYYIQNLAYSWEINKQEIQNGINGSKFEHVDAALYAGWKETKGIYLFSESYFEYVIFLNDRFSVVERGNINTWGYPISFAKVDAAGYFGQNVYMLIRKSKYILVNAVDKIILQTGYIGEYFKWNINIENVDMQFNYDTLMLNVKGADQTQFILKKFCDDSLQKVLDDYTVQKVNIIFDIDKSITDEILYQYDTYMATYIRDAKMIIYNEVNAYVEEEV